LIKSVGQTKSDKERSRMDGNFLITGAAQGFGKEFSRRVLRGGGRVLLSDKNPLGGEETCKAFQEEFGLDRCTFQEADVSNKADWEDLWSRANSFFNGRIDVLVNNAGVSPVLPFDTVMKVNFDGVLLGAQLFAEKQSIESGGSGGLVINTASIAGILYGMDKNSISYQISKHAVVALTRSFGDAKVVRKTGIKHVAICPWFADTGILDGIDKSRLKKQVKFEFVTVEMVGEAFEQVVRDQKSGALMMIMSGCQPTYYPDLSFVIFAATFLLSRISGALGNKVATTRTLASLGALLLLLLVYIFHITLSYFGI